MRLLRRTEVEVITALTRSSIYAEMAAGRFPKPLRVASKAVRWKESEIVQWMDSRPRVGDDV